MGVEVLLIDQQTFPSAQMLLPQKQISLVYARAFADISFL